MSCVILARQAAALAIVGDTESQAITLQLEVAMCSRGPIHSPSADFRQIDIIFFAFPRALAKSNYGQHIDVLPSTGSSDNLTINKGNLFFSSWLASYRSRTSVSISVPMNGLSINKTSP